MRFLNRSKRNAKPAEPESVRLVVVESGAYGFEARMAAPPDDLSGDETIVIAQTESELPAHLAIRVAARIAAVDRSERRVGRAILLVGSRRNDQVLAARRLTALAVLSHLLAKRGGELVLDAEGADLDVRDELLSLVETLLEEDQRGGVPIRLQFRRAPPPKSQPRASRAPSSAPPSNGASLVA